MHTVKYAYSEVPGMNYFDMLLAKFNLSNKFFNRFKIEGNKTDFTVCMNLF